MIIVVDEPWGREGYKMHHKKRLPFCPERGWRRGRGGRRWPNKNKWLTSPSENMQPTKRTMENKLPVSNQEEKGATEGYEK